MPNVRGKTAKPRAIAASASDSPKNHAKPAPSVARSERPETQSFSADPSTPATKRGKGLPKPKWVKPPSASASTDTRQNSSMPAKPDVLDRWVNAPPPEPSVSAPESLRSAARQGGGEAQARKGVARG